MGGRPCVHPPSWLAGTLAPACSRTLTRSFGRYSTWLFLWKVKLGYKTNNGFVLTPINRIFILLLPLSMPVQFQNEQAAFYEKTTKTQHHDHACKCTKSGPTSYCTACRFLACLPLQTCVFDRCAAATCLHRTWQHITSQPSTRSQTKGEILAAVHAR